MKRLTLVASIAFFIISAVSNAYAYWNDGGTLHQATIGEWKRATYRNKLATAADIAALSKMLERKVRASGDFDTLKIYANQLVICIDEATDVPDIEHLKMNSIAGTCALTMGWLEEN
jgi:hypothetical protein